MISKQRTAVLTSTHCLRIEPRTETRHGQALTLGDRLNVLRCDCERSSPWNISIDWYTLQSEEAYLQEAGIVFDYIEEPTYLLQNAYKRARNDTIELLDPSRPQIAGSVMCERPFIQGRQQYPHSPLVPFVPPGRIRETVNLLFVLEKVRKAGISGEKHGKHVVVKQGLFSKSIMARINVKCFPCLVKQTKA